MHSRNRAMTPSQSYNADVSVSPIRQRAVARESYNNGDVSVSPVRHRAKDIRPTKMMVFTGATEEDKRPTKQMKNSMNRS